MCPFPFGEGDKQHRTGERHRLSGLIQLLLPSESAVSDQRRSLRHALIFFLQSCYFFPVLKMSDLAISLQLPITQWQRLSRLSRTQEWLNTVMDTSPGHHKLLGPCSHTLITPFSLGLASNWAAVQTHIPQPKDLRSRSTGHTLPEISVLILMDVRKIYPERSCFTSCVFWCICSFSTLGSPATTPSPNPRWRAINYNKLQCIQLRSCPSSAPGINPLKLGHPDLHFLSFESTSIAKAPQTAEEWRAYSSRRF